MYITELEFPQAFKEFLFTHHHPTCSIPDEIENHICFSSKIQVFHSAITCFYSPSDLCGTGGMYWQCIQSNPSWYCHPCRDTVFVAQDEDEPGMQGMLIAWHHLLFSFINADDGEVVPCALVSWFIPTKTTVIMILACGWLHLKGQELISLSKSFLSKALLEGLIFRPSTALAHSPTPFHILMC